MASRNWGLITNGATFEALARTLVFFEDPNAALFGRRGKDGGQDARSGDGTRVFQAKHHEDDSAAKAIADAKKEAAKIAEYRTPGHARHDQWKGVTHWCLVTNAAFNPTDREIWDSEVVPLFANQGLRATYWERADLDGLLDKHPEVDRSFFQNETRALLTLPEIRDRLPLEQPFLQRNAPTAFFGRENETEQVRDFLASNALFLVVHGAGGIGKTRLLLEAGERLAAEGSWQVLWANIASMSSSGAWFEAIQAERATLLLVDEPEDEQLLRVLSEQLGGRVGRASKWKVAVAVRSPKDPVLRFLFAPRMEARVHELAIAALSTDAAEGMCNDLLSSGPLARSAEDWRKGAVHELVRRFSRHPVWLTLAVHVLEKHGDLTKVPSTADELAACYLEEIVGLQQQAPREQALALLRWVALIGTVNREDDATVKLLGEGSSVADEAAVRRMLATLVERRGLVQRGARNRLIELKPDVLRDHVLLHWLSVDVGYGEVPVQPSADAKVLVARVRDALLHGNINSLGRSILRSLARTELILRLSERPVPLLDPFFAGIRDALERTTAGPRIVIAEVLLDVATFRPADTVALSRALRSSVVASETIEGVFRRREVGQDDVVLKLAWPVFHAAMGAGTPREREQVLEELCALTTLEAEIAARRTRGLPRDGRRAAELVGRTLEGGPEFWADFEDAASTIAARLLADVSKEPVTPAKAAVLRALLEPAVALERRQTWSEDYTIHIQTYLVLPGQPAWKTREAILGRAKDLLAAGDVPVGTRVVLWALLADAHRSTNQCRGRGPESFREQMRQESLDDLVWAHSVLARRKGELNELTAARDLWHWHYRFEKDLDLKTASEKLEALYASNELASEFEPLVSDDEWEQRGRRTAAKAAELAACHAPEDIVEFIARAVRFLGSERELHRLLGLAGNLGEHAHTSEPVRNFVRASLAEPVASARTDFATVAAASWVATLRKSDSPTAAHNLVVEVLSICGSDDQRINLLRQLYPGPLPPRIFGHLTAPEHDHLRSLAPLFLARRQGPAFIKAVGWTIQYDWPALKTLIERTLDGVPNEQIGLAVNALVDAAYWTIRETDPATIPPGLGTWLLDQLLRLPDLDSPGDTLSWHVEQVLRRVGHAPLSWLPGALERRRDMEAEAAHDKVRAVSHRAQLSSYVTQIAPTQVNDPDVTRAVKALVDLVTDQGTVGYHLPEVLRNVDPGGLLVPAEVARRLASVADKEEARRLARIAGAYAIGAAAWRTIAKPVIARAVRAPGEDERRSLFSSLTHLGPRTWSGTPGEVPQIFIAGVQAARHLLESETDAEYRPFWEWYLAVAEAELREQEEEAKEERGE